jgi:hypothetical protein
MSQSLYATNDGRYKIDYELNNDTIRFTIDAKTTGWVSFGMSAVPASGTALGFHKAMDTYIGSVSPPRPPFVVFRLNRD